MTLEEYKLQIKELESEFAHKKKDLGIQYAKANSSIKIGDVVTDHIGSLKVEKISFDIYYGTPCCVYFGTELKKDGTPAKNQTGRGVHQSNLRLAPDFSPSKA